MDPDLLTTAALVVRHKFLSTIPETDYPTRVIGVPNRGKEFATTPASTIGVQLAITDRSIDTTGNGGQVKPWYNSEDDKIFIPGVTSFTSGECYTHSLRGVNPKKDKNVLIVDDFCATGAVTTAFYDGLKTLDINSYFVYMVAKNFPHLNPPQIGFQEAMVQGKSAYAVVIFTGMENGKVVATTENIQV